MKYIIFLIVLLPSILFGQNRIASQSDITLYGNYITVGDLIIDTPTKKYSDGINQLAYTKISTTFPGIRENATIWVDGKKLGPYCEFRLLNEKETKPWHISSATIRPIPGTRMDGVYTLNGYGGFLHLIQGLKNISVEGGSDEKYPGLSAFPKERIFMKGSFGISGSSNGKYTGYHVFSISVIDSGKISIRNIEGEHGFSVIRLQGGSVTQAVEVTIENCYIHDSMSETTYIGFTHAVPGAAIRNLIIRNCIIARSGSEALQMQHLVGNAHVSNVSIFDADVSYLRQFMPGQDTGIQLSADEGNNLIENITLDSWGSNGFNIFGSDAFPNNGNSKTTIRNIFFNNGRGPAFYLHNSAKFGMKWFLYDLYFRKFNNDYFYRNKALTPKHIISAHNGSDSITFGNLYHDNSMPSVFQNVKKLSFIGKSIIQELPDIEYVNSGYHEPSNRIRFWFPKYIGYIAGNDTTSTEWEIGDIAIDIIEGSLPLHFKSTVKHYAKEIRPRNDPRFMLLTWDEKGVRSDQPTWNRSGIQRNFPPDDFRIKAGSFYAEKNMGFVQNINKDQIISELKIQVKDLTNSLQECKGLKTYEQGISETINKVKDFANGL